MCGLVEKENEDLVFMWVSSKRVKYCNDLETFLTSRAEELYQWHKKLAYFQI